MLITAPVFGRPVNCNAPYALVPLKPPAFRLPRYVPVPAVVEKSYTTSNVSLLDASTTLLLRMMVAVPLSSE